MTRAPRRHGNRHGDERYKILRVKNATEVAYPRKSHGVRTLRIKSDGFADCWYRETRVLSTDRNRASAQLPNGEENGL